MRSRVQKLKPIGFTEFQFPTLVEDPPEGGGWIHEIKCDGYRTQIVIQNGQALIYTRTGIDWTVKYPHIAAAAGWLKCRNVILDGEVILPHEETGKPDFQGLRSQITRKSERLVFVAFDLLHLNGEDLRPLPCIERRAALQRLLGPAEGLIQFSHHIDTSGKAFFKAVDTLGLEGIVSKLAGSAYMGGQGEVVAQDQMLRGDRLRDRGSAARARETGHGADGRPGAQLRRLGLHHVQA